MGELTPLAPSNGSANWSARVKNNELDFSNETNFVKSINRQRTVWSEGIVYCRF